MNLFYVETISGRVAVTQSRDSGFPVVMIHGNSLSGQTFINQLNSRVLSDFRIIAPDLPGHGKTGTSSDPANVYSPLNYIRLIIELCIKLDACNGILVGHSLGGHMIISALRGLQEVKGALVFGTPPLTVPPRMDLAFLPCPSLTLAFKPDLSEEETFVLASGFVKAGAEIPEEILNSIKASDPLARQYIGKVLMSGQGNDEIERIKEFAKPFAILHGEEDQLVNPDYLNSLKIDNLWEGRIHLVKDSGHSPQVEQPVRFNELLKKFIIQGLI